MPCKENRHSENSKSSVVESRVHGNANIFVKSDFELICNTFIVIVLTSFSAAVRFTVFTILLIA